MYGVVCRRVDRRLAQLGERVASERYDFGAKLRSFCRVIFVLRSESDEPDPRLELFAVEEVTCHCPHLVCAHARIHVSSRETVQVILEHQQLGASLIRHRNAMLLEDTIEEGASISERWTVQPRELSQWLGIQTFVEQRDGHIRELLAGEVPESISRYRCSKVHVDPLSGSRSIFSVSLTGNANLP